MPVLALDTLELSSPVIHSETTDLGINVFTLRVKTLPLGGDEDILVEVAQYVDEFMLAMKENISFEYAGSLGTLNNITQGDYVGSPNMTWQGLSQYDALPPTVSALFTARTAETRITGRKYIMGIDQESDNTGRWTSASLLQFNLAVPKYWEEFTGSLTGVYEPGVWTASGPMLGFHAFKSGQIIVNNRTQRSRTIGRGI